MTQLDPAGGLVIRLDRMVANLQQYIDQRAAEEAEPLIAKAREAAMVAVERAQHEKQRAEDLVAELRRQLRALEWGRNEQKQRAEKAEATVAEAARAEAVIDDLTTLIRDLTYTDPCEHDHHGHCQAHGWTKDDRPCPHARARDILAAQEVGEGRG